MRFLRAHIRDFRSIKDLELDLTEPGKADEPVPVAVLVGPNGSGKTAVLDALVRSSWLFSEHDATEGARPSDRDVRSAEKQATIGTTIRLVNGEQDAVALHAAGGVSRSVVKTETKIVRGVARITRDLPEFWRGAPYRRMHINRMPMVLNPPSVVYLDAARHAPRGAVESVTPAGDEERAAHAAAPSIGTDRHQWTKQRLVNLKFSQMLEREDGKTSDVFDRLWPAVEALLEHVRFREITRDLRIVFDTPSGAVEFDDLSSGEKSVVLMFLDLLVRDLDEATVLIDEIELHLHPAWQARILGALRTALPTCQLIVTTQSPIVAASVEESKYLFDLGKLGEP